MPSAVARRITPSSAIAEVHRIRQGRRRTAAALARRGSRRSSRGRARRNRGSGLGATRPASIARRPGARRSADERTPSSSTARSHRPGHDRLTSVAFGDQVPGLRCRPDASGSCCQVWMRSCRDTTMPATIPNPTCDSDEPEPVDPLIHHRVDDAEDAVQQAGPDKRCDQNRRAESAAAAASAASRRRAGRPAER